MSTNMALKFLFLSATRSGETRGTMWSEVDWVLLSGAATWTIRANRMKAKKNHRVPLSPRAVAILRQALALGDGAGLVFPGTKAGRPLSDMTLSKLVKELGFDGDVHGFRTSFRTWAQELTNFPREVAEAALARTAGELKKEVVKRPNYILQNLEVSASGSAVGTAFAPPVFAGSRQQTPDQTFSTRTGPFQG